MKLKEENVKNEYANKDITIVWQPHQCIHSGICIQTLPQVYNLNTRPWIKMENATTDELISQVNKCPLGALSYYSNTAQNSAIKTTENTKVEILKNGPLLIHGSLEVVNKDGKLEKKRKENRFLQMRRLRK